MLMISQRAELPVVATSPSNEAVDAAKLREELGRAVSGEVRFDRLSRALYSTDASVYQIVPVGVVIPKTEADILATLEVCRRFSVPITPRGGGTSQAGQAIGPGVQLDCSKHFSDLLEVNAAERWVRVRPGCVLDELNASLKPLGLHFPIDISTSNRATLGGMIANNSSGTRSVLYGKTGAHVLDLKVALADGTLLELRSLAEGEVAAKCAQQDREGECYRLVRRLVAEHADEIERRYPKILRRVGGYDLATFAKRLALSDQPSASDEGFNLAHLFIGSEGTLGITLEAELRLQPLPKHKGVLVVQFADLLEALAAAPIVLKHGPSAVEVIDQYILDSTKLNPEASRLRSFLQGDPAAILIIEFYGDTKEELPGKLQALETELAALGRERQFHRAFDPGEQGKIWKLRKFALGLSMAEKGDAKAISFVEDTAVAPERLRDYIAEFLELIRSHGTRAGVYAHASVGCLHVRPVVNLKTAAGVKQFEAIAAGSADLVLKYGGAISGEHGDGLVRSSFQEKMYGPALYQAFRTIKQTFDPQNLLNPGKIVDAPPMTASLRYGPSYVTPEVATTFDFSADGGLVQAAELCAGVGECRKKREGTMCPSYQATRDEQHCTRGRANSLRLALTGQLGFQGLTDPAVKEVLDLCLECKACKAECPTNVDMARLKAEFLHQYHKKHGLPWRNWIFGNVARLSRWPFVNRLSRNSLVRWMNDKLFGIDKRRIPPDVSKDDFAVSWIADEYGRQMAQLQERYPEAKPLDLLQMREKFEDLRPHVLIYPDTFVNDYEPKIGRSAGNILESLGLRVCPGWPAGYKPANLRGRPDPQGLRCCGRPMISNGMLDQALANARHNVEQLYPWALSGRPIIACEPSCILTIKDDYPALLRGKEREYAKVVTKACYTFDEFLESLLDGTHGAPPVGLERLKLKPGPKKILVEGHCHQQALVGMGPTLRLLRRIPGAEVIDLEAGCCGMAGSFGYEKEHYEVSRLVGEQRLFPAIRQADADTVIVAPGFSCRMQIEHFTGRKAVHPAELLYSLVEKE